MIERIFKKDGQRYKIYAELCDLGGSANRPLVLEKWLVSRLIKYISTKEIRETMQYQRELNTDKLITLYSHLLFKVTLSY